MSDGWDRDDRRREVERLLDEMGAENLDGFDDWDGDDLDALQNILDEDQYEALMDRIAEEDLA
jgi:hypothetical protein